ncbi:MAG: hydrogenase nickel incorporation protein HypB [Desulfobacterium sp.]|nr:hydrogenase nickel incorporation protein HypB [Desulfobacterium sp.]MBU3946690.1 hydrogenase nickel incorporation protein HypB [Pseudomonadota bacterium]MBU4011139.1 hydrogenase nickel incorporation protein HypB [Pseudomonadota bacterium]MBU4036761.1 hydrogenase nickel incorporation protein HypB [Pseudomonadota bacterium]
MKIPVIRNILEANDQLAAENKSLFKQNNLLVLNLMSSPGAGKTTLLERTIDALKDKIRIGVIEGDIQTTFDAERIAKKGVATVQINTDGACHLDGKMIRYALKEFDLSSLDLLVVENVGNLVCPAEFEVGEDYKIMILSVTEGDDKPPKYPLMFSKSSVLLINKIDLLPYIDASVEKIRRASVEINPNLEIFEVSCRTQTGLDSWFNWILQRVPKYKTG